MTKHTLKSPLKGSPNLPVTLRDSDALPEVSAGSSILHRPDGMVTSLAAHIRKEKSLFIAFLQALHERDAGEYVRAAALLQEAVLHLKNTGELLLLARQELADEEEWKQWLRYQCLIDHSLANHYMELARKR
jgi:hypothetical protein